MQIVLDPKKLARQEHGEYHKLPTADYIPDVTKLPEIESENGLYAIRDFKFCRPVLWSSGKASAEQIIIQILCEPNMHDFLIIRYYFGARKLLDTWDKHADFFKGNRYATEYLTCIFDRIRERLGA